MFDAFHNFFHGHAVGFANVAAKFVYDFQPFLRHGARTVHHDMRVGQRGVDFFDSVNPQHFACGRAGEFICAVARAHRNRQRVHIGVAHKAHGIGNAGEHLVVAQFTFRAHAVFLARFTRFQIAQHADFAFHRHAASVRELHHAAGYFGVVFIARRRFAVFLQRAVHHH